MSKPGVNESAQYFEDIFNIAHEGIIFVNHKGIILSINPAFTKILGYEEHEILGKHFYTLAYKDQKTIDRMSNNPLHRFDASTKSSTEIILLNNISNRIPVRFRSVIIRDEHDQVTGAIGIIEQMATLEGADGEGSLVERMWEAQQNFDNVLNNSSDVILICDISGYIMTANKAFLQMLDYTQEEVSGKHVVDFCAFVEGTYATTNGEEVVIDGEYVQNAAQMSSELFEKGYVKNWEMYYVRKDKVHVPVETTMSVLQDKDAERRGSVVISRDITERRKAEKDILEARDFLENIFKTTADGIMITDNQGTIIMVNEAVGRMLGFSENELIGKSSGILKPEGKNCEEQVKKYLAALFEKNTASTFEFTWLKKDGNLIDIEVNTALLRDTKGNITGTVSTIRDITERKQDEAQLKETKDHLDNIIESSLDCIVASDSTGYITRVNDSFLRLLGYQKEEVIGKFITEFTAIQEGTYESILGERIKIDEEYINDAGRKVYKLYEKGRIVEWKGWLIRKDKKVVFVEQNIVLLYNKEGNITGSVAIIRDITEKKNTEKKIKEAGEFLENIFKTSADGIVITNPQGIITMANEAAEKIFGYHKEELAGKGTAVLKPEGKEYEERVKEYLTKLFEEGVVVAFESVYQKKDGSLIEVESNAALLKDAKGNITGSVTSIRDITERKEAEERLREAKEFLENIIESSRDGILITDDNGSILSANTAIEKLSGYNKEELVGEHPVMFSGDDEEMNNRAIEELAGMYETGSCFYESKFKTKDGKILETECSCSLLKDNKDTIVGTVSIIREITDRKKMEEQLLQSEKLRSLGELAGGVAHDFNNCLAAILGRAQLLKMMVEPPPGKEERRKSVLELKKGLEVIEQASLDGAETVRRIQEFARRRDDDKYFAPVDINEIIENSIDFTKVRWKNEAETKGIRIDIQKDFSTLPTTTGSATELREVVTNLINNAVDAMPQGGAVKIKTYKEDNHIFIKVEDTGIGISRAIRDRVFDPFFTTKGPQASGLGMSVSYGIINRHRGTMVINSTEGEGTTFTLKLPIAEKAVKEEKEKPISDKQKKARILVIEDEKKVCELLSSILTAGDHEVETASDGSKGIKLFKEKEFDLVFTDLGMPGVSGWQVAEKIKSINKNVPVALITGWNVELKESEMREKGVDLIAYKPFEVKQVFKLVQEGMILKDRFKAA